jgi:malate dehydrogenase (oxaloacetate-decarboxylating)
MAAMSKDTSKKAIILHKKLGGKIRMVPTMAVKNRADLSLVYTPGVAAVSMLLANEPEKAREYTIKGRMVAVISDGSAVLGLGNIGPLGALPVMEGKAALFKTFGNVDSFPIVLDTQDTEEIIETIIRIAPVFGGINLEDFAAPKCFEIERRLIEALDIPVMHDDQHGTAIVVLAGLINALKVVKKDMATARIVIAGAGAAGTATAKILHAAGARKILVLDRQGIIARDRALEGHKQELAMLTNPNIEHGDLREALDEADVLIGLSGPGLAKAGDIKLMAPKAIVFALANPTPEIMPSEAKRGGAAVIATGRSDFPNQLNNSLAFPGIFRGALDNGVKKITEEIKVRAAHALANLVKSPTASKILPDMFDPQVAKAVAKAVY